MKKTRGSSVFNTWCFVKPKKIIIETHQQKSAVKNEVSLSRRTLYLQKRGEDGLRSAAIQ